MKTKKKTKHPKQKVLFGCQRDQNIRANYSKLVSIKHRSTKLLFGALYVIFFKHIFLHNGKMRVIWSLSNLRYVCTNTNVREWVHCRRSAEKNFILKALCFCTAMDKNALFWSTGATAIVS